MNNIFNQNKDKLASKNPSFGEKSKVSSGNPRQQHQQQQQQKRDNSQGGQGLNPRGTRS